MEELRERCVKTYGGVCDLEAEQVKAHSSGRFDTVFAQTRTRMGERVDRLHCRFTKGAKHIG
jgi:hypothetical protein